MKTIPIEIPEGKQAKWIDGVLTLVDEDPKVEYKFQIGNSVTLNKSTLWKVYTITDRYARKGHPMYTIKCAYERCEVKEEEIALIMPVITDRIKTFDDAIKWCEENGEVNLVNHYDDWEIYNDTSKDIIAYLKLRIITCALNEGWEPTFGEDEERWHIIYDAEGDSYDFGCSLKWEPAPNKLVFKSERLAEYAAHQFCDFYADFYGCNKKGGDQ